MYLCRALVRRAIGFCPAMHLGEMAEWSNVAVSKSVVPQGTGGSNPSLSANKGVNQQVM